MLCRPGIHWFPISTCIVLPVTFFTSYIVAVLLGHVEPGFPYISDTGTYSPESCIFGQGLNIGSVLAGITIYIRFRQINEHQCLRDERHILRLNKLCLFLGIVAAFGISIVGNFQETNVLIVHLIGAMMAFGVSAIYTAFMTYITYKCKDHISTPAMCHFKAICTVWIAVFFASTFIGAYYAKQLYQGDNPRKWFPHDGGFTEHVISTASEWAMAIGILGYFMSFVSEFLLISMEKPPIYFNRIEIDVRV